MRATRLLANPLRPPARGVTNRTRFVAGRCGRCGAGFCAVVTSQPDRYCAPRCAQADRRDRRRAREAGAKLTAGRRWAVFERDGWVCRLCGLPVDRAAKVPHLEAPVIDHVVPLAAGGEHGPHNWQTAHFWCNSYKGDRVAC